MALERLKHSIVTVSKQLFPYLLSNKSYDVKKRKYKYWRTKEV